MKFCKLLLLLVILAFPCRVYAEKISVEAPAEWLAFLADLKQEMLERGISQQTLERAYGQNTYYHERPEVVEKDKKQTEFVLTSEAYLNRLVNVQRVENVRKNYKMLKENYDRVESKYGVPLNYLAAFWGLETNFGQNKGHYQLVDGLTNLSYNKRRSKFFKNELYHLLKIMEDNHFEAEKMRGSWAGAMGHFQFMPSTYASYATDWDGDGFPDIWDSFPDALASAANYLHSLGFKAGEPWGGEVVLPWDFDFSETGRQHTKTVADWEKLGVHQPNKNGLGFAKDLQASLILPDGRRGKAYLVFRNFKKIMIWNRSENYALAICFLAEQALKEGKFVALTSGTTHLFTSEDIEMLQTFANEHLGTTLKVDGNLGPQTKKAIAQLQEKAGLPADGYPDYRLLQKIKHYDPQRGFHVPRPLRKSKK